MSKSSKSKKQIKTAATYAPGDSSHVKPPVLKEADKQSGSLPPALPQEGFAKWFPTVIVCICVLYLLSQGRPRYIDHPMPIRDAGKIPASLGGRVQPLDSVARNTLMILTDKQTFEADLLRAHQVKDWQGLCKAIVDQSTQSGTPGHRMWSLLKPKHHAILKEYASGDSQITGNEKEDDLATRQMHVLDALNFVLDDERREVENLRDEMERKRSGKPAASPAELNLVRFYSPDVFSQFELIHEQKALWEKVVAFDKAEQANKDAQAQEAKEANSKDGNGCQDSDCSDEGINESESEDESEDNSELSRPSRSLVIELNRHAFASAFSAYVKAKKSTKERAIVWLWEVATRPDIASTHRVFRIVHPRVQQLVGLEHRDGFRYAIDEFANKWELISDEAKLAAGVSEKQRDAYQEQVLELGHQMKLYGELAGWRRPYLVPPQQAGGEWMQLSRFDGSKGSEDVQILAAMLQAFRDDNVLGFENRVEAYVKRLENSFPSDVARAKYEVFFNEMDIFTHVTVFYLIVFFLVVASWMMTSQQWRLSLRKAAFSTLIVLVVAHSFGMISRMYLQGRPPVTNLYASSVFIGWGVLVICLFIERVTKQGFGSIAAAIIGFITGVIAISLRGDGDTLEMQRAVLDTNFWLATHVTTVTLGYAATFLAGVLGILFVILGMFTNELDKHSRKTLAGAIYATVCFAMLFSFIGTVLGGIWADQSWGRFWGWDPKENGALMIVIWNALILHARWGGLAKARGIALLAIFGNVVTAWSWFGTNMLGAGLHAYGFIDSAVFWLILFVVSQMVIILIGGLVPTTYWKSYAQENAQRKEKLQQRDDLIQA